MVKRWAAAGLLLMAALWGLLLWTPAKEQPTPQSAERPAPELPPARPHPAARPQPAPPPPAAAQDPTTSHEQPQANPARQAEPLYKLPDLPPPEPQGPLSTLKLRFGNESPSQTSKLREQTLRQALQPTGQAADAIADIACRRSICRISWRWKRERVIPFMRAVGVLRHDIDPNLGIDAAGPPDGEGTRSIDMYLEVSANVR